MNKQDLLNQLECAVMKLNEIYKYTYTEQDLDRLNMITTIEQIDQIKDEMDICLFYPIISLVLEGAEPKREEVYNIIRVFNFTLGLDQLIGTEKYEKFKGILREKFGIVEVNI